MPVYMLCKLNERGDEIFLGAFESEEKLLEAIPDRPKLTIVEGNRIAVVSGDLVSLDKYRVKTFELNTIREDEVETDLPDICITVPSGTDATKTYGVAIKDGKIVGCSCPAFQFSKDGAACKHMTAVRWNPGMHGLYSAYNGYQMDDNLVSMVKSAAPLPGSYYARFPSDLYR